MVEVLLPLVGHGQLQTDMLADQISEWCRALPDADLPDDPEELTLLALAIAAGMGEGADVRGISAQQLSAAIAEAEAEEARQIGEAEGFVGIWPEAA